MSETTNDMSEFNQEQLTCRAHTNSDDFSRAKA